MKKEDKPPPSLAANKEWKPCGACKFWARCNCNEELRISQMAKAFPGGENQFQMYAKYYGKLACRSRGPCSFSVLIWWPRSSKLKALAIAIRRLSFGFGRQQPQQSTGAMSCFCGRTKRPLEEVPLTCHVFEQTDDQKTLKSQIYFSIALLLNFVSLLLHMVHPKFM